MLYRRLCSALLPASLALVCVFATYAAPAWSGEQSGAMAVSDVRNAIANGDCKGAVSALNRGLAAHHEEVQLLAGTMYENGICLKANWDRAVNFYTQAYNNGHEDAPNVLTGAGYHLAAGFAAPENGPDVASALWWGSRAQLRYGDCMPTGDAATDPDKFLAEVKTWSDARIGICTYEVGVIAAIAAEVRYMNQNRQWAIDGNVLVTFKPAVPRIDLTLNGLKKHSFNGEYNGERPGEPSDRAAVSEFTKNLRTVADRALKRYPKPNAIPADLPDVTFEMRFGPG
jgi:hypothetical protein